MRKWWDSDETGSENGTGGESENGTGGVERDE